MSESQRILELEEEIKTLKAEIKKLKSPDITLDSLSGTFFVVDLNQNIQLVKGNPPKGYQTPPVPTELTMEDFRNNRYNRSLLSEFRFPGTKNIIFRRGFAIHPDSFEGKVISFLYDEQKRTEKLDEKHRKRFFEITNMDSMDDAIKHVKNSSHD